LLDVPQRVEDLPVSDVAALTPRPWKEHFVDYPRRSAIDRGVNNAVLRPLTVLLGLSTHAYRSWPSLLWGIPGYFWANL
jgi:hypothetical protein